jgi:epoxyqueuosine reductase
VVGVPEVEQLRAVGLAAGLDAIGVATATPFDDVRAVLEERRAAGLAGGMAFTYRNPARSTDPDRALPGVQSLVVGARRYRRSDPPAPAVPAGAVARYARVDHYAALRASLGAVAETLTASGWRARVVCDDNALVDRAAAHRAGIGWFGKNANLLVPGAGSWFVLGTVLTDAPLVEADPAPVADGCSTCSRCIDACPTGAIVAPGVVDARRCLAWLVQAPGAIPVEYREAVGGRLYGCDDCQEVCPPNRAADRHLGDAGADSTDEAWIDLLDLLVATDDELLARHGRWYVPRRDPRHLRRNALVVLGNTADPSDAAVAAAIDGFAAGDDELLVEHARWAQDRLAERRTA